MRKLTYYLLNVRGFVKQIEFDFRLLALLIEHIHIDLNWLNVRRRNEKERKNKAKLTRHNSSFVTLSTILKQNGNDAIKTIQNMKTYGRRYCVRDRFDYFTVNFQLCKIPKKKKKMYCEMLFYLWTTYNRMHWPFYLSIACGSYGL